MVSTPRTHFYRAPFLFSPYRPLDLYLFSFIMTMMIMMMILFLCVCPEEEPTSIRAESDPPLFLAQSCNFWRHAPLLGPFRFFRYPETSPPRIQWKLNWSEIRSTWQTAMRAQRELISFKRIGCAP